MSEMVERAARALAVRRVYAGYNAETRAMMIEREMYGARRDVRIVLEALRKPTDEMFASLGGECLKWAPGAWAEMIDAALQNAAPSGDGVGE
jgi:hypothetical protein